MSLDHEILLEIVRRARAHLAADSGRLWGPVEARWIFCSADEWLFTEEVSGATFVDGLWRIPAPGGLTANTAVEWDGRWWAQLSEVSSVGTGMDVLMLHELWHATVQRRILDERTPPAPDDVLETVQGRALFMTEIAAWRQAIDAPDRLSDAVAIRRYRHSLTGADEWERQRLLELTEGLPEYSGIAWANAGTKYLDDRIAQSEQYSIVRSGCYQIGPSIAMALDAAGIAWRDRITTEADLASFAPDASSDLEGALVWAGYDAKLAAAQARDDANSEARERRRAAFAGPLLRLQIASFVFDPRYVESVEAGPLYVSAAIKDPLATVEAADGMVIAADFQSAHLACPHRPVPGVTELTGPGWTGTFPQGWEAVATWSESVSA